jgi:hypothetical protein
VVWAAEQVLSSSTGERMRVGPVCTAVVTCDHTHWTGSTHEAGWERIYETGNRRPLRLENFVYCCCHATPPVA